MNANRLHSCHELGQNKAASRVTVPPCPRPSCPAHPAAVEAAHALGAPDGGKRVELQRAGRWGWWRRTGRGGGEQPGGSPAMGAPGGASCVLAPSCQDTPRPASPGRSALPALCSPSPVRCTSPPSSACAAGWCREGSTRWQRPCLLRRPSAGSLQGAASCRGALTHGQGSGRRLGGRLQGRARMCPPPARGARSRTESRLPGKHSQPLPLLHRHPPGSTAHLCHHSCTATHLSPASYTCRFSRS